MKIHHFDSKILKLGRGSGTLSHPAWRLRRLNTARAFATRPSPSLQLQLLDSPMVLYMVVTPVYGYNKSL